MEAIAHIFVDEDGIPRTINRRVKVSLIAPKYIKGGASAEEIAEHYQITPADVFSALAYYHDHKTWFEQREQENRALLEKHGRSSADVLQEWRSRRDSGN